MNLTATPLFPMQQQPIDCSSFVNQTFLPSIKGVFLQLLIASFICDAYQIFLMEVNKQPTMMQWGIYGSMIFKVAILSIVLTFP